MKNVRLVFFACLMSILFYSCSKGPTGQTGSTGPQGPAGNNVTVKQNTYNIPVTSWGQPNGNVYTCIEYDPQISNYTEDVVEVYLEAPAIAPLTPTFNLLPLTDPYLTGSGNTDYLTFSFVDYYISFLYTNSSPEAPLSPVTLIVYVIPPSVQVKHPRTDWNNTAEVARLPEMQEAMKVNR
jgi:hypothetical protein